MKWELKGITKEIKLDGIGIEAKLNDLCYSVYFHVGLKHLFYCVESNITYTHRKIGHEKLFELHPEINNEFKEQIIKIENVLRQQEVIECLDN